MNLHTNILEHELSEVRTELRSYAGQIGLSSEEALEGFIHEKKEEGYCFPDQEENQQFYDELVYS